jgi:hypothetical protein
MGVRPGGGKAQVLAISPEFYLDQGVKKQQNGGQEGDPKRDFLLPIRFVRTPNCVQRIPDIKNVIATYQPTSVNDHPNSFLEFFTDQYEN